MAILYYFIDFDVFLNSMDYIRPMVLKPGSPFEHTKSTKSYAERNFDRLPTNFRVEPFHWTNYFCADGCDWMAIKGLM